MWGGGGDDKVRDTLGGKKIFKSSVFTSIIRVRDDNFVIEVFFHKCLKLNEYIIMNLGFLLMWIKPNRLCEVINKDTIIF